MTRSKGFTAIAAAMLASISGISLAADSKLVLVLGGEAYDGAPEFSVSFDGKPLGSGAVDTAIDTETSGRFADVADKSPYVQSFEFAIPEDVFTPDGELRVKFTNEAFGGEGSNRDRNLFLVSAAVNGRVVLGPGFTTASPKGAEENQMVGDLLALYDNEEEGVSAAPEGGWPTPDMATVEPAAMKPDAIASIEPDVGPARSGPVIIEPKPAALVADTTATIATDAVDAAVEQPVSDRVEVAAINPEPVAAEPGCNLDQIYNVIGFNENSNDLTPKLMERLDQIAGDIGTEKCTVQITGYSSTQGDYATNALFAIERAQNVFAYLKQKGMQFEAVNATGAGETTQFGEGYSVNRRVVITVTP